MPTAVPERPRVSRLFAAAGVLLAAVLGLSSLAADRYRVANGWVEHTLEVQEDLSAWAGTLLQIQNDARAYLASANPAFLEQRPVLLEKERQQRAALERLVADNSSQSRAMRGAEQTADAALAFVRAQVELATSGQRDQALTRLGQGEGQRLMNDFRAEVALLHRQEEQLLAERRAHASMTAWLTLLGALATALGAAALLTFAWRREVRHEILVGNLARDARKRLRALSDLAAALAATRTLRDVADVVVDHGMRAADGDTCTLYKLNDSGDALELLVHRGIDPVLIERLRTLDGRDSSPGTYTAFKEGRTVWVQNEAEYHGLYPKLAGAKVEGRRAKAFWSIPLVAEGRALGLLGVGFYEPRSFSPDERAFVDTLAKQCAQALLRATRAAAEEEARRWFSTTLRSIGDAVIATDRRGRVTFLNPIAERLTGFSEAEALGQPLQAVFQIISEQTRATVESPVTKVLREGQVVGLANHTLLLPKSGPEIPIDDSGAPIRNEAGEIVGVVLVFRDVSAEKRQESRNAFLAKAGEALVSSLDYQTTLATVARLAVPQLADWCAVDLQDPATQKLQRVAVAHVDPAKVRLAEELGRRYPPDPDAPRGAAAVMRSGKAELIAEITPELLERAARDADHLRILRELSLSSAVLVPLQARTRCFGVMTFVYADSSRRYRAEDLAFAEDLARRAAMAIENSVAIKAAEDARARERWLREEAERTNRLKDEFLATASHELRTPLNAILGWTLTLRRGAIDVETDRALSIVERNARAQAKLIEDVLDVSRIVSGKLVLHLSPTSLAAAAHAAIETITPAADAKGISIVAEIAQEPSIISADADRLQQVIWNLLSNAVKFTPKDGRVLLRVFRDGSDVCALVKDSGEGIRPELLDAIFEPFQQADASTTRRHGGLGLGLSIVKQLVVAHGGTVSAASDGPGKGASFLVRLPLRAVAVAPEAPAAAAPDHDPLTASAPHARLDGLRVLVVDDEPDARLLVREILKQHGAEVTIAESAAAARRSLTTQAPDVIVSDIGMPDEDGYSFIRGVRASGARTPAIALTAYASPQDAQRAFVAGFQKHVTKPVEPARLVSVVANLGGRSL
jgi:PAS domain S-box-containing protein